MWTWQRRHCRAPEAAPGQTRHAAGRRQPHPRRVALQVSQGIWPGGPTGFGLGLGGLERWGRRTQLWMEEYNMIGRCCIPMAPSAARFRTRPPGS